VVDPEVIERIALGDFHHIIDLYQELAQKDRVGYCRTDSAFWSDIGTPTDYLQLHARLLEQKGEWQIDPSARVGEGTRLSGWGCVGAEARIGTGVVLHNCVVWPGAVVPGGARVEDAIITGAAEIDQPRWSREEGSV